MTHTILLSIGLSAGAGLLIEAFFQLIKYKDAANTTKPRVVAERFNPTHYMSVTQFIAAGNRKWVKYFAFRYAPPTVIFILLASVLQRYFNVDNTIPFVLLACVVSLVSRDIMRLFSQKAMASEKIIHAANIAVLLVTATAVGLLANTIDISFLAPSLDGLVDNLWAALFTAILVAVYIKTSTITDQSDDSARSIELSNMVLRSYNKFRELHLYAIIHMCSVNNASVPLLYAILIYEDMNRPAWFRRIENIIVRFTNMELTVGIAQVKSNKPLTDVESMSKAAKILKNTKNLNAEFEQGIYDGDLFKKVVSSYNEDSLYQDSIASIIEDLHAYAGELFIETEDILGEGAK